MNPRPCLPLLLVLSLGCDPPAPEAWPAAAALDHRIISACDNRCEWGEAAELATCLRRVWAACDPALAELDAAPVDALEGLTFEPRYWHEARCREGVSVAALEREPALARRQRLDPDGVGWVPLWESAIHAEGEPWADELLHQYDACSVLQYR